MVFIIAEEIERTLGKLVADDTTTAVAGTVRVGAPEAFTSHIAVPALARIQQHYPDLDIEIFS
ncbi:MAG TPA: LysR substrate-binding domain-containing protein [Enteractinococcus sp.]